MGTLFSGAKRKNNPYQTRPNISEALSEIREYLSLRLCAGMDGEDGGVDQRRGCVCARERKSENQPDYVMWEEEKEKEGGMRDYSILIFSAPPICISD